VLFIHFLILVCIVNRYTKEEEEEKDQKWTFVKVTKREREEREERWRRLPPRRRECANI
jgi:hypothetical protein